jgi:hypothetical protein
LLALHTPLAQSFCDVQSFPGAHGAQGPLQSTSDSPPFLTPSEHVGTAQIPPAQTPLEQSLPTPHAAPSGHALQLAPPQSTSVSPPFFTLSVQVAV